MIQAGPIPEGIHTFTDEEERELLSTHVLGQVVTDVSSNSEDGLVIEFGGAYAVQVTPGGTCVWLRRKAS